MLLGANVQSALAQQFKNGTQQITIETGLLQALNNKKDFSVSVSPISISYEYCVSDSSKKNKLTLGYYLGYAAYNYRTSDINTQLLNILMGIKANYHLPAVFYNKLTPFVDVVAGYKINTFTGFNDNRFIPSVNSIFWLVNIGGQYQFSSHLSGIVEVGMGVSYISVGAGYSF